MIEAARLNTFESTSTDGAYTFTVSPTGSVHITAIGEVVGVKILDFAPASANTYVKITDEDVTGTTGTILSLKPSGTTPIYYPVRQMAVSYDGVTLGSPNVGVPLAIYGNMTITVGSVGSPVVFSGLDIFIRK